MAAFAAAALFFGVLQPGNNVAVQADTAPEGGMPVTAGATGLPTAQINGVVWSQQIVGDRVFVGGSFTAARPAGTAAGSASEVPRANMMAYNLVTGALDTTFAPVLNGQVKAMALSPDKSILYVAGQFTTVNGSSRYRVAAFNTATGALLPFQPSVNSTVNGIAATSTRVYLMGAFTTVGGVLRDGAASVLAGNATVTAFNPLVTGGDPRAVVISPDETKVVIGGNFTAVNGSSSPGYGLAMVTADTGASLPMPVNSIVRDANTNASILALVSTSGGFYGSGYRYGGSDGNLEGMFRADWNGNLVFLEDCHGDTYSLYATDDVVYTTGHSHYCGNDGGFLQPVNWVYWRAMAWSNSVQGTVAREHMGYYNFEGQPRPAILDFFPDINSGTYTGLSQGPWEVTGNGTYVVFGGEFTQVNGVGQQGLVRFAYPSVTTSRMRPVLDTSTYNLRFTPMAGGRLWVHWPTTWDRDNERLTYNLYRNAVRVYTTQALSRFYSLPQLGFIDSGLTPGTAYAYQVRVSDPDGNLVWNSTASYTYQTGPAFSDYDLLVMGDGPSSFWRLNETGATTASDLVSGWDGTVGALVTEGTAGAIAGSSDTAFTFNPTTTSTTSTVIPQTTQLASNTFSVEAWFKTTSNRGGALVNFGTATAGSSGASSVDRVIYVSNDGRVFFGIQPGVVRTVNATTAYNDGRWHHAVATLGLDGVKLYLDGALVAANPAWTNARNTSAGLWRIGGDRLAGWPSNPSSGYLSGSIDQVAVYPVILTAAQVAAHYSAGVTAGPPNQLPVAAMSATVSDLTVTTNSSGSSDPDGTIVSYSWNFGDGSAAVSGATASHTYATGGTYTVTLTVTDDRGGTAQAGQQVTVVAPNQVPTASFTWSAVALAASFDGSGSSDPDGTIASYAWDFGDGSNATGAKPTHTYAAAGTYTVVLSVTDNSGGTGTAQKAVAVTDSANVKPTAAFTQSVNGLTVSVDGSTSSDSDGTIAGYAWSFGDGSTGTGVTANHPFVGTGSYLVTLTVTDNAGATDSVTHLVTVGVSPIVADAFNRTVTRWGNADTGGTWTYVNGTYYSTDGASGVVRLPAAGSSGTASLAGVSARDVNVFAQVAQDTAFSGNGTYNTFIVRQVSSGTDYRMTVRISSDGTVRLNLTKRVAGTATSLGDALVSGLVLSPGDVMDVRFVASGNGTTNLEAKAWKRGATEPATAQLRRTDTAAELQVAGAFAVNTYLSSSVTTVPVIVRLDNLLATTP